MPEILSQQEIDSLLSGISAPVEKVVPDTTQTRKPEKEVLTFDFRLPNRLSKNQLKTLQAVHDNFGEALASFLVAKLQTTVSIEVISVDQIFYSEYVLSIANPSALYIYRVVESDALALLELSPQFVLACVSRMLGGSLDEEHKPRNITRIEQSIIRGIVQRALSDLQKAWKTIAPLTFNFERYESEGDFAQIAPASEIVLVICFEIRIAEKKFMMNLCFPTFALEDVLSKLNIQHFQQTDRKRSEDWHRMLASKVEQTTVCGSVLLGTTAITVRDLLDLTPGDVLRTDLTTNSEIQLLIGDKPRCYGYPGVSNGKYALKVTRVATDPHNGV